MTKRITLFLAIAVLIFLTSYYLHQYILDINNTSLLYSLLNVYSFHLIASCSIYIVMEIVCEFTPSNTGYMYLALMFVKFGFFLLLFQASVFGKTAPTQTERISLIIPLFLFLILEATAIAKLLNSKEFQ